MLRVFATNNRAKHPRIARAMACHDVANGSAMDVQGNGWFHDAYLYIFILSSQPTDAELAELQALHKELEKAAKPGKAGKANTTQFFAINEQFHMRLLAIANNR